MCSNIEVVAKAKQGDHGSFEVLFRRYYPLILRYFRCQGVGWNDAHDLCQDTFLAACKGLTSRGFREENTQGESSFVKWLCRIARNRFRDFWKKKRPVASLTSLKEPPPDPKPQPPEIAATKEIKEEAREAIGKLPPADGEVVDLKYWDDLEGREVAERLHVSPDAARKRLQRARQSLKVIIETDYPQLGHWVFEGSK